MSIPFDANTTDYAELSKGLGYSPLIYQDKKGDLFLDHDRGFFAPVTRFFYSLIKERTYQLDKIVNTFASCDGVHEKPTAVKNLEFLCGKIAHSCGIDDETYKKVLIAEKFLHSTSIPFAEKEVAEGFFASLSQSPELQKQLSTLEAKFTVTLPEAKELHAVLERAQITRKWLDLGLDLSLLNNDYEGAKFLVQGRLIYSIIGYQNSTEAGPSKHKIEVDSENKMMIKKQGSYVRVSDLSKEFVFDKSRESLKGAPGEYWNYFSPDGLVPVDRWLHPELIPVEQLSKEEMDKLRAHAKQFYPDGKMPHSELPRDAIIQIFTNPREEVPHADFPLMSRLAASFPLHAAIRIITSDGNVYSTGFGANVEEYEYREKDLLATVNGVPTILDFEEFRKHEGRIVTTIPATSESCEAILKTLNSYRKETLRFNLASNNCVRMATDALDQTGVKVNTVITGKGLLEAAAPSVEAFPLIGEPVGKMRRAITNITEGKFDTTSEELLIGAHLVQAVFLVGQSANQIITYIPSKLVTLFSNVMVYALGGATGSPLPKNKGEGAELLEEKGELKEYSTLIRDPLDLFKEETSTVNHALPLIQWQLQQGSTAIHLYSGQPAMGILPPEPTAEAEEKKKFLDKRYLTNFGIFPQ